MRVEKNVKNYDRTILSVRLKSAEAVRFWRVMDAAKVRNAYLDKSDVIRELLGLAEPSALTPDEIEYFRKGKEKKK